MISISFSTDDKLVTVVGKVATIVVAATMWSIRKFRQSVIKAAQGE